MTSRRPVIAVVDDDPRLLESIENLLESAGYSVRTFAAAEDFLEQGPKTVDLLITDIGMPGIGGLELSELVSRQRPALPVFLISGRHEIAELEPLPERTAFFRKPFDAPALLAAIVKILKVQDIGG